MTEPSEPTSHEPVGPPPMPRWVKVVAIVVVVLAIALVAKLALDGGGHGPGQHLGSAASTAALRGLI